MGETPNTDWTKMIVLQHPHELLQDGQQRVAAWTKRRQEALATGIDAIARMSGCKSPVEMVTICGEWMSGSISRIIADFEDAQAHAAKMAEHLNTTSKTMLEASHAAATPAQADPAGKAEMPSAQPQLREAAD
jgi:hypothetical protein